MSHPSLVSPVGAWVKAPLGLLLMALWACGSTSTIATSTKSQTTVTEPDGEPLYSEEAWLALQEQLAVIISRNQGNCAAMGQELTSYVDQRIPQYRRLYAARQNLTVEQKKAMRAQYTERWNASDTKLAAVKDCISDTAVKNAYDKIQSVVTLPAR